MEEHDAHKAIDGLGKNGLFLVSGDGQSCNVMTIGWGFIGRMWRKETFIVPIRLSRHSHDIVKRSGYFTVCVPGEGEMAQELAFCGSKSGRDVDKVKALNLRMVKGRTVPCPVIAGCSIIYECRVMYTQPLDGHILAQSSLDHLYADQDYHTMFYGEITDCYGPLK
ncbi:MAG: flavin reductase family protein [Christensenellales bacterium]